MDAVGFVFWNPSLFVVCVTPSCPLLPLFMFEAARLRPRAAPVPCVAGLSISFSSGCEEGRGCQRDLRPSPICVCTELQLRPLVYFEFSPPVGLCQAPSFVSGGECHVLCCLCCLPSIHSSFRTLSLLPIRPLRGHAVLACDIW